MILEARLNKIYHDTHSDFQQISVIDTYFGKTLVTDGKTQSTQFDEFAYHESLVHPALLNFAHCNERGAKTVLIGGGTYRKHYEKTNDKRPLGIFSHYLFLKF